MTTNHRSNKQIADLLDSIADHLEEREANPFRIRAYRNGARTVRSTERALADLVADGGPAALEELPNIGEGLAGIIVEYVHSGHSTLHDQLQAEASPQRTLMQVPGIGEALATHIVQALQIETLPALEIAAHDGRLAAVEGFGPRRVQAVQQSLAGMLSPAARRRSRQATDDAATTPAGQKPAVATLLAVDEEYRTRAAANDLPTITPRRFNPDQKAWLPILHTSRAGWRFTALFSNTARAHELQKTDDWVVIYYSPDRAQAEDRQDDTDAEAQATVVTETQGARQGQRVVRGREAESQQDK